ncbi:MAG TPA: tripartite tricarboxylate transporter substrate binding protein [Xanthobacteraceae bacterium]
MGRSRLFAVIAAASIAGTLMAPRPAPAQTYPNHPIRLVVGFAAGGNTDLIARIVADKAGGLLGQRIIVENRGGANGAIAADTVAKAPPDGYTLFFTTVGAVAINPAFRKDLPYDPVKDFAPVGLIGRAAPVLASDPGLGLHSAPELVALARQKPNTVSIGITGIGAISHLGLELFESTADVKFVHVPFRGSGPALADLLGGHVNGILIDVSVMLEHIKAGKITPLGIISAARSDLVPEIPTLVEQGYAGAVAENWTALFAPAKTSPEIIAKLNAAFTAAVNDPDMRRKFAENAITPSPTSPDELGQLLKGEIAKWDKVIREKGITIKPED